MKRPGGAETLEEIASKARIGDERAFSQLVDRYQDEILRLMRRFVRNPDDALDLTQDAFVQAWERIGALREPERFGAWLRAIACNAGRQWLRRQGRVRMEPLESEEEERARRDDLPLADEGPWPASPFGSFDMEIRDALARLSPEQRAAVQLHYRDGFNYREIGARLGLPQSSIRSRLQQARIRLKKETLAMMTLESKIEMMERKPFANEPEARALYDGMLEAFRGADSLSWESAHRWSNKADGEIGHSEYRIRLKKPGLTRWETFRDGSPSGVLVGDGETFWTWWPGGRGSYGIEDPAEYERLKKISYMKKTVPASRFSLWHHASLLGTGMVFQASVFHGYDDPIAPYLDGTRYLTTETANGAECDVIEASFMDRQRSRYFWIAKSDRLPRQLCEIVRVDNPIFSFESWTNVDRNPDPEGAGFRWSPPEGWVEYRLPQLEGGLLKPGTEAPDFRLTERSGELIRLSDFRGRPVLLAFWRVGCQSCREEMPALEETHRRYRERGLAVLGYNFADEREIALRFLSERSVTFLNVLDNSEFAGKVFFQEYQKIPGFSGVPLNYVVDREGRIADGWYGFDRERGLQALSRVL